MAIPDWSTIKVGDVFEMVFPGNIPPPILGMVTLWRSDEVMLRDIMLQPAPRTSEEVWADEAAEWVSQDSLFLPEDDSARRILRLRPEFHLWANDSKALKSFGVDQPAIPVDATLDERLDALLRHEESKFILSTLPQNGRAKTARFMNPFRNHAGGGHIIRQHVTVFAMNGINQLVRVPDPDDPAGGRYILPAGGSYAKVDAGNVLFAGGDRLALGTHFNAGGSLHWHDLKNGSRFAVETAVLRRAGIDPAKL